MLLKNKILLIRLIRPFLHFVVIVLVFYLVYLIRQRTDLIPFVHLKIPYINLYETVLFSILSAVIFILI